MGSRFVKFEFTPDSNEQIEVKVKLPEEPRSIIHGTVRDHKDRLVKNAVVKLFEVSNHGHGDDCDMLPITHTFTDDCGQFLFGPLCPHKKYVIKIWVNDIVKRELPIHLDDCEPCDLNCDCKEDEKPKARR